MKIQTKEEGRLTTLAPGEPGKALAAWLLRQGLDPYEDFVGRYDAAEGRWFFYQEDQNDA